MKHAWLMAAAALSIVACDQTGDGADQLDTADLESREDTPASQAPEGADSNAADDAQVAEQAMQQMAQPVACSQEEQTLFFCEAGRKQIAVCGVSDAQGNPVAQYRYGSDTAEIMLTGGRFSNTPYSGGGESQIQFAKGPVRYIVYSRTIRTNFASGEPNNPEFTDGVLVVRDEEVVADRQCTARVEAVDVMAGESYGGVSKDIFYGVD
ncbi:hypothetical protein AAG596_04285 [Citromicrobium bathyomarinum]|uniref:hypothetical protein n=1 Tax=Citromicrobium bathyomarinum TaxID=72174 RepID=UPI00315A36C4